MLDVTRSQCEQSQKKENVKYATTFLHEDYYYV